VGSPGFQLAEQAAERYERWVGTFMTPMAEALIGAAGVTAGQTVLDVACGTGFVSRLLADRVGPDRVTAVDVNPAMLAVARRVALPPGAAPVAWVRGSAQALPFPAATFDLVLCQQGLQFFPDGAAAVREMRRMLRPGGRAVLSVYQTLAHNPVYDLLYTELIPRVGTPHVAAAFSLGDAAALESVLAAGSFRTVSITPVQQVIRLPEPDRCVELTVAASAAAVPSLARRSPAERAALAAEVRAAMADALAPYRDGDHLRAPMAAHIVVAEA
jgi:ubiquinone/menaquinone biosynthesis C-methylase UbiE